MKKSCSKKSALLSALFLASAVWSVAATPTTASAVLVYDSDSLVRLAMDAGLRSFIAKHGTTTPLTIRFEPGTSSPSAAMMVFEAKSPDGLESRRVRFSTITGEQVR